MPEAPINEDGQPEVQEEDVRGTNDAGWMSHPTRDPFCLQEGDHDLLGRAVAAPSDPPHVCGALLRR
jgi:hypothetical protein